MRNRINRVVRVVVPAVVAGLLLSGCSGGATPGTAVVVGSERLTVKEVQERTAEYVKAYPDGGDSGVTPDQVSTLAVQNFIENATANAVAAQRGITVTETQVDDFITQLGGMAATTTAAAGAGLLVPPDPVLVRDAVRHTLVLQAIGTDLVSEGTSEDDVSSAVFATLEEQGKRMHIEVNPRFGVWDGSTVTGSSGSISTTLAELKADPETPAPAQG